MKDFIANNFVPAVGSAMMLVFVLRNVKMTKIRKRFFAATLFLFLACVVFRNADLPKTSVSAGLCFSENGFSRELFTKADKALYYTKTTTRRACTVYSDEMEKAPSENGV